MLQAGERAPRFRLNRLEGGVEFDLDRELEKGPVMVVFLKRSCPTCRFATPLLERAARKIAGDRGQMLLVLQEMPWEGRQFVEEFDLRVGVALDEAPYPVSGAFGVSFVPSAFLIDCDGSVSLASESFERDVLAEMTHRLAKANGVPPAPFHLTEEQVPIFRPG